MQCIGKFMSLSMFRYPGGKGKFLPVLSNYLDKLLIGSSQFADVFVGGGSVLLDIAKRHPKMQLFANDKNYWIYCFWNIVAGTDFTKLEALLNDVAHPVTLEQFYKLREEPPIDDIGAAYRAIFFNRTTFSGIVHSGPIGGKDQNGKYTVNCRYNAKKLKEKILICNKLLAGRTIIENKDFSEYSPLNKTDMVAYLDPPYVKAGKALYSEYMNKLEHEILGKILLNRKKWILSYDDSDMIREIYSNCSIYDTSGNYSINGVKTHWSKKNELIIIPRDLR